MYKGCKRVLAPFKLSHILCCYSSILTNYLGKDTISTSNDYQDRLGMLMNETLDPYNLTFEQQVNMRMTFLCGDCNHLALEIVQLYPKTFELALHCKINGSIATSTNDDPYCNHVLVRNMFTGNFVDIAGVYAPGDYEQRGFCRKPGMRIFRAQDTELYGEALAQIATSSIGLRRWNFPVDVAINHMQYRGWLD